MKDGRENRNLKGNGSIMIGRSSYHSLTMRGAGKAFTLVLAGYGKMH
jgi:hypothetical protein